MSLFSVGTIQRFEREGEDLFNQEFPCILDRLALDIVEDTSEYTLPDYITEIRRVTYRGFKVDALDQRHFRDFNLTTESGRPTDYIYNNIGQLKIKLFPAPNETLATITTNLWGSEIPNRCIIEFWRTSDYTSNTIPEYFKEQLVSAYKFSRLYAIEGKGQNLKLAKYFNDSWLELKELYGEFLGKIATGPGRTSIGLSSSDPTFLVPHLSVSQFGISVGNENF